jgi:MFS family permease
MMLSRLRSTYHEFPPRFWILVGASFIDGVGRTLIFPFFALYVTQKFNVGMTQAGVLLGIFSVSGFVGNLLGGGLTDRFGRRSIVISGLIFSSISALAMGLIDSLMIFYALAAFVGLLSDIAGPAQGAMVADMLPERQRAEGFGMLRVAGNLAWIIGPTIGGLMAAHSFLLLFILDAVFSLITALIVYLLIPETMPGRPAEGQRESIAATFSGYRTAFADRAFAAFLLISVLMNLVYLQLYSTFSVYLRDVHQIGAQGYGMLMSINAGLVVAAQFWVTRQTKRYAPLLMMALGTAFYLVGFTAFGLIEGYVYFIGAMLLVTIGEMVVIPVSMALVAQLAPEDMRGRYMAVFSLSWAIPAAIGPWAAGMIMDNLNPDLIWHLSGVLSAAAVVGFVLLHAWTRRRLVASAAQPST